MSPGVPFSFAGGADIDRIRDVQAAGATVAVVGGSRRNADDPSAAVKELRDAITG